MDWNSLLSAIVGGLLTVIPVLITIRNQSIEREKDRQEHRRDARIQALERALGSDIEKAIDLLSSLIRVLSQYGSHEGKVAMLRAQRIKKAITDDKYKTHVNLQIELLSNQTQEIVTLGDLIAVLVSSLDDEISVVFTEFLNALAPYVRNIDASQARDVPDEVLKKAGRLHRVLREKKISILSSSL